MTTMADMKSALVRLEGLSERAETLRPGLESEAAEALDVVQGNARLMRAELDELLRGKPDIIPDPNAGLNRREQAALDENVALVTRLGDTLEAWLGEWGA